MGQAPLAIVYRGPAALPGCPEAAANALASSRYRFRVEFTDSPARNLGRAALYCQPGGGSLKPAWRRLRKDADAIAEFVRAGGRYLGICLGGYLAGDDPGFGLLDGSTDSYVGAPGSEVRDEDPQLIDITWNGQRRTLYFQDGCFFKPGPATEVVARYPNGLAAAVITPFGAGWVGVVGPHPEATDDWFIDDDLPVPTRTSVDLAHDLIHRLVER